MKFRLATLAIGLFMYTGVTGQSIKVGQLFDFKSLPDFDKELIELKEYYTRELKKFNDNLFVFGANKPLAPTTIERRKNKYCEMAGVKQIRIHDFRHSHASMLLSANIPI